MSTVTDLLTVLVAIGSAQLIAMAKMVRDIAGMKPKVNAMWADYKDPRADGGVVREISVDEADEGVDTEGDCP